MRRCLGEVLPYGADTAPGVISAGKRAREGKYHKMSLGLRVPLWLNKRVVFKENRVEGRGCKVKGDGG